MRDTAGSWQETVRDRAVDGALIVLSAGAGLGTVAFRAHAAPDLAPWVLYLDCAAGLAGCVALWWRRRYPVPIAAVLIALCVFSETVSVAALVMVFTVAVHHVARTAVITAAASLGCLTIYQLIRPETTAPLWLLAAWIASVHVVAVVSGMLIRSRRQLIASLRERAVAAEVEAGLRADRARHEARETLAREMHDVLGHRLSLLSVSAGALTYHRAATPDEVGHAAELIRDNAHRALQDLREVIGVLRAPDGDLPLPGIADLVELIDESGRFGTPVALDDRPGVTGADPPEVPATVGRTVYRLVQEGLTNARKHAPGAAVRVVLTGTPGDHLTAEVVDAGTTPTRPSGVPVVRALTGTGQGLRGLAERATLVGGRLDHGPTDDGGWRLVMRLPWPA